MKLGRPVPRSRLLNTTQCYKSLGSFRSTKGGLVSLHHQDIAASTEHQRIGRVGRNCGSNLTPGRGTPYATGWLGEKKKRTCGEDFRSSLVAQWVKDLALSVLWQGFDSWPGCSQKKKKKSSSCDSADEEPHTVSLRTRVQSLASISGLRIWHCHKLWHRSWMRLGSGIAVAVVSAGSCSSDSTPSLGTSTCCRSGSKKRWEKRKKNKTLCFMHTL